MDTITELLLARAEDDAIGLRFGDGSWSYRRLVEECSRRAELLADRRPASGPFHVGVLLDNVPEFWLFLGAAALAGATVVGVNPTRRGEELARDIAHTDCAFLVTERSGLELLGGAAPGVAPDRCLVVDGEEWAATLDPYEGDALAPAHPSPADTFMLIFTSGTTGAPKAVRMGHGRLTMYGSRLAESFGLGPHTAGYSVMPLFHSNAAVAGYANLLAAGATCVLRRRFSASAFLDDVRRYGVTFFNYVGKPLTYILATPERPDDADNPLQVAFGNEAAPLDVERFAARFGCIVVDGYGSTEGGITMTKTLDTPRGSLGVPPEGMEAAILDPATGAECPRARFDAQGRFLNPDEAIGEIVNPAGAGGFEGYYRNPEADAERMRGGMYWTGDLGYRDEAGYFYFAGRNSDWLRVDGENFAAAPVEAILARHPDVALAAVYAVPAVDVGDEVMAALVLRHGAAFDPAAFAAFLEDQPDLSPKWVPRYVRIAAELPSTHTMKVVKRVLRAEHWETTDPVWVRSGRSGESLAYGELTSADRARLRATLEARGRAHLLGRA